MRIRNVFVQVHGLHMMRVSRMSMQQETHLETVARTRMAIMSSVRKGEEIMNEVGEYSFLHSLCLKLAGFQSDYGRKLSKLF